MISRFWNISSVGRALDLQAGGREFESHRFHWRVLLLESDIEYTYSGKEDRYAMEKLLAGHICKLTGYGNSMTPKLSSGQSVICIPVTKDVVLKKKDIVFCKVNGHYYLHLISAVKGKTYQISNNHGHVNGTISRNSIYGKVVKIL